MAARKALVACSKGSAKQAAATVAAVQVEVAPTRAASSPITNAWVKRTHRWISRTARGSSSSRLPPHSLWLALSAGAADPAGGGAGPHRRRCRGGLCRLGVGDHPNGGPDGAGHRGVG